jgi:hypothetical protein
MHSSEQMDRIQQAPNQDERPQPRSEAQGQNTERHSEGQAPERGTHEAHGVRIRKPGAVLNPRHALLVKWIGVMNKLQGRSPNTRQNAAARTIRFWTFPCSGTSRKVKSLARRPAVPLPSTSGRVVLVVCPFGSFGHCHRHQTGNRPSRSNPNTQG